MTWTINGVDPKATYGLAVSDIAGWQDAVQESYPTVKVPGTPGMVRTSLTAEVQARRLTASGYVVGVGSTLALRATDARTKMDGLRALLMSGPLTIIMADRTAQFLTAYAEQVTVNAVAASMITDKLPVKISLVANDPYFYDNVTSSIVGISGTTGTAIPLGTAPSRAVMTATVSVATVNPSYTLLNSAGVTIGGLVFAFTMQTTDSLVVDHAARTVTLNGILRNDLIAGGDFFSFDAAKQGDYASAAWPKLVRGTNMSVTVAYRKAWR